MADSARPGGSAAWVVDFAVAQILRDDTTLGGLSAVLERLVEVFGLRAAYAFQASDSQGTGGPAVTVLAEYPEGSADPALLARLGARASIMRDAGDGDRGIQEVPIRGAADGPAVYGRAVDGPAVDGPAVYGRAADGPAVYGRAGASALLACSAPVGGRCLCAIALIGDDAGWDEETGATAHAVAAIAATQVRHTGDVARLADRQVLTRALIDESPTATVAMDAEGRLLEFNPAAERLHGFRRDDVLGRDLADFLVPERFRQRFHEHLRTYAETGDPEEFTGTLRIATMHADGTERTTELTPVQITMNGEAVFTGFLRDLTEIERSHAALEDQTELLNCLIANAIPGVLFTDEHDRITHVSQGFGALFGIADPEQLVGTSGWALVSRIRGLFADPDEFARRTDEVSRVRKPIFGEEMECADGRTIEAAYWPVLVEGQYRGDLWVAWDMSARKRIERRRNQFLATVSHEMRTPLTSIISFIELIRGEAGGLTPEGMTFLDVIERNADRLHRLVGDLLMLDRLEAGALPLDLTAVDVAGLVTEAVASASPGALKQGVTIEVGAEAGPPVCGDYKRLMQVLDNLIANAVKFSHRNGLVRVTVGHHEGTWRIDVADSGIGIPEAEAGQLFSRFVRASNAQTAGLPGAGLGLSIVRILVEMHGGHVEVRSELDRGSTFSVYLPVAS